MLRITITCCSGIIIQLSLYRAFKVNTPEKQTTRFVIYIHTEEVNLKTATTILKREKVSIVRMATSY